MLKIKLIETRHLSNNKKRLQEKKRSWTCLKTEARAEQVAIHQTNEWVVRCLQDQEQLQLKNKYNFKTKLQTKPWMQEMQLKNMQMQFLKMLVMKMKVLHHPFNSL